ncbi:MAG: thermonuclease family protein [Nitrospirae bacterium]|nr:MAG: thermonuclease family protein [Nitrospirota bacterium]
MPGEGQAYGTRAKHAASALVFEREVIVQTKGHDKYKRAIGDVILPDGKNQPHSAVCRGGIVLVNLSRGGQPVVVERFHKNNTLTSFFIETRTGCALAKQPLHIMLHICLKNGPQTTSGPVVSPLLKLMGGAHLRTREGTEAVACHN